ncbi:MAG: S1 RNA-binding domain-containing protein, partial [Clostridia bacterium]|nr:S1 RNA-binding domain-containing protein [Clostridia bacterium]
NIMSDTQGKKVAVNANDEAMNEFESAMKAESAEVKPKEGQRREVTVVSATNDGIVVSFGGKTDAFIDRSEVEINEADYNPANYVQGQGFVAEFIAKKGKEDMIAMSKKVIAQKELDRKKYEEIAAGNEFTIKIDKAVPGGLIGKLGPITVFVPQSQIRIGFEKNPEKYVGKELRVRKIEAKNNEKPAKNKIVASHSIIAEEEKRAKEDAFWSQMIPNTIVKGVVKRFTPFGAFVSVNKNDCLAHISDLSWVKVKEASEVLEINKTYDFLILNADRETGKVSLGYKQLQKKPYEEAQEKYPVGSVVKGTVERIFAYGAFVSIDKGIDGLIPVSEISYNFVKDANEAFKAGQEVEAKVIKFDGSKITLSVKALLDPPAAPVV